MEIKELYHYMVTGTEEQNDQAIEVLSEIMHEIQKKYPAYYKKYDDKLEKIYKHNSLTKEEAQEYVSKMKNKDGSYGGHWTYDQTTEYMLTHEELRDLNRVCFYVAMNMMYSDYYKPTRTVADYAMLAKDFLTDPDGKSDKVKRYMEVMQ